MKPRCVFPTGERTMTIAGIPVRRVRGAPGDGQRAAHGCGPALRTRGARSDNQAVPSNARFPHRRGLRMPALLEGGWMAGITRRALWKTAVKPPTSAAEIEAKHAVPDHSSFEMLRALEALGEYRLVPRAEQRVTDHYLDTQGRVLLEAGYACRRRVDEAGGPEWVTVKGLGGAQH